MRARSSDAEADFAEVPQAHDYYWGLLGDSEPTQISLPKPQAPRGRRSILGLLGLVALAAINLKVWADQERTSRRSSAEHFARMAALHRLLNQPLAAAWADHKRRKFEAAVERLWWPQPEWRWDPPPGWTPPAAGSGSAHP